MGDYTDGYPPSPVLSEDRRIFVSRRGTAEDEFRVKFLISLNKI
jgi:hypothetical protein